MKKFYLLFAALIAFQSLCFIGMTYLYVNSDYNRYDLKQISDYRRDQFLIDKKTGKIWNIVVDSKGDNKLQEVPMPIDYSKLSDKELLDLANVRMK